MKIFRLLSLAFIATFMVSAVSAQSSGTLVLADGTTLTGNIKNNISRNASVQIQTDGKKKTYTAAQLTSAQVEGVNYRCISGDFFKVICTGNLCFLQKASDASGTITYNGTEAVVNNGTDGKPGDYFLFNTTKNNLQLVSVKNLEEVIQQNFNGNAAAIEKARTAATDISQLKEAVTIFNNDSK
ncbi:MAG: hypothetical protein JNM88_04535 [Chitinophagaceae bacterium]|nr:hypothetical protein [Chitinophagaceae bacterium]